MRLGTIWKYDRWIVIALLGVQALLFWLSLDAIFAVGVFCTVADSGAPSLFGYIHFVYAGLFLLGLASVFRRDLRVPYIFTIAVALAALPMQVWLVHHQYLQCEGP